ncbi:MAG: TolC family protein [Phycisphaerales bacterium]|nr:MAG: TolC family protein [Phycisphaerales bacterium]
MTRLEYVNGITVRESMVGEFAMVEGGKDTLSCTYRMAKVIGLLVLLTLMGCRSPSGHRANADKVASDIIQQKQLEALGETEEFGIERPSDILRRRLLEGQNLRYSSEASLGTDQLGPIAHWPEPNYPRAISSDGGPDFVVEPNKPVKLSLIQALEVGARNSPDYQTQKEAVFREALALDLERNNFRNIFVGQVNSQLTTADGGTTVTGVDNSASVGVDRMLKSGAQLSTGLAVYLANLWTAGGGSSGGLTADASISVPFLRGSGRHIVTEPLTQAERNVVYAIYGFERFKRTFAVDIAGAYLDVLGQVDQVDNEERNYRSRIVSARYIRRLADSGRRREIEVDQAVQGELGARNRWISAQQQYLRGLDTLKRLLGLPVDARIELDRSDLELLRRPAEELVERLLQEDNRATQESAPADAEVELVPASTEDAGRFELDEPIATRLAFDNRLDLQEAIGRVYDAQRQVVVRADRLGADLTLFAGGSVQTEDGQFRVNQALLRLDLPLERTRERNEYRNSLIDLEQATRSVQTLEDQIKLSIRNQLRALLQSRESLKIQARSVVVAQKQVKSSNLFLEAGLADMRDLREAQDALVAAENSLTSAVINYRITELDMQRDMGLLKVDESGLWQEYSPEVTNHVEQ